MKKELRRSIVKEIKKIELKGMIYRIWQDKRLITIYSKEGDRSVLVTRIHIFNDNYLKIKSLLLTTTDYNYIGDGLFELF